MAADSTGSMFVAAMQEPDESSRQDDSVEQWEVVTSWKVGSLEVIASPRLDFVLLILAPCSL